MTRGEAVAMMVHAGSLAPLEKTRGLRDDKNIFWKKLLFQQAGVAGHAEPFAAVVNPGIGEASGVLVGLVIVGAADVVRAENDGGVAIEVYFHVADAEFGGLVFRVVNIGEELG